MVGYRGVKPTLSELVKNYYWSNLGDDVEQYVKSCVTCQQNRTQFRKVAGMLRPLPISMKCWESVSMDFMTHLLKSKGFDPLWWSLIELASCVDTGHRNGTRSRSIVFQQSGEIPHDAEKHYFE